MSSSRNGVLASFLPYAAEISVRISSITTMTTDRARFLAVHVQYPHPFIALLGRESGITGHHESVGVEEVAPRADSGGVSATEAHVVNVLPPETKGSTQGAIKSLTKQNALSAPRSL